jgi:hypothetical protein
MGYSADDERFTHQWPRPFSQVHEPDGSWSDRCYFFAHSPDGTQLVTNGFGNNPNQGAGMGYGKVALADGRHHDLMIGRAVAGDREHIGAGGMEWTCVEPLEHWRLDLAPNPSGVAWEMHYRPRAPMWELLPMHVVVDGRVIVDMYHMKETGTWTGWYEADGVRTSIDGWPGGRDRTFGVRVADEIDFWLWLDIGFEDRAIQAWVIEAHDGTVQYVDGGITHIDGALSKRFVSIDHQTTFDGDRKRPAATTLVFTDEDGRAYRVEGVAEHQHVNVYYGLPLPTLAIENHGDGEYLGHFPWDSSDRDQLVALEGGGMSIDQLMRFDLDGMVGHGIFEILSGGRGRARYLDNWPVMDMTPFRQRAKEQT